MSKEYHVRIANDSLVFSAAHFITLGDYCERLHGHNYRVAAEVWGPLDDSQCVIDFVALRESLAELILELDHYVLLPTDHPRIRVTPGDQHVEAVFGDRRWEFPRADCVLLPLPNTTAEMLAEYLGRRLLNRLEKRCGVRPKRIRIEVDECSGQIGSCELAGE